MAQSGSWPSIRRLGLLSTTALLDLFGVAGEERLRIESRYRPASVEIAHPSHGSAVIRDQMPMPESRLRMCLIGVTPEEWYRLINRKTFFWTSKDRLVRLLSASAYRGRSHTVITVDTQLLLQYCVNRILLSPINSGSTYRVPARRSPETFKEIQDYPVKNAVAELAVDYSVPGVEELAVSVEEWMDDVVLHSIWQPA